MPHQKKAVAHINDLRDGEMKEVSIGDTDLLLSRIDGTYYAMQGHCSHYGASLAQGALSGTRVICPWHHACFDVTTGQHLEAPGLDGLPTYEVTIEGDQVMVQVPDQKQETVAPAMVTQASSDEHTVIVGGGPAAIQAVQAMRAAKYPGKITLITAEDEVPYDRTALSKKFLQDAASPDELPLRPTSFYEGHAIQLLTGKKVSQLNADSKTIRLEDGDTLSYDQVLVCTGSKPKKLPAPGADFPNVYTLRSFRDSQTLKEAAQKAKQVVIVGASFIGMECAASLQKLGCTVTVVSPDQYPFADKWGERVGKMIKSLHEAEGVVFKGGCQVERIEGNEQAERVVLDTGETLPADGVLVGIGVQPVTDFVVGLDKAEDGGIAVDTKLHAGKDVYVAGDIARFQYQGNPVRIEHWRLASQQGTSAGRTMAGQQVAFDKVPFFWTAQQGNNIRYVGFVKEYDEIIYQGKVEEQEFIAFYLKDGQIRAALGMNKDADLAAIEHLMQEDRMPEPSAIRDSKVDWQQALRS